MGAYYCEDPEDVFEFSCLVYSMPSCINPVNCNTYQVNFTTPTFGCWRT